GRQVLGRQVLRTASRQPNKAGHSSQKCNRQMPALHSQRRILLNCATQGRLVAPRLCSVPPATRHSDTPDRSGPGPRGSSPCPPWENRVEPSASPCQSPPTPFHAEKWS